MFNPDEVIFLEQLLDEKVKLIISGLDLDYQGKMHETVRRLLELGPKEVRYRRSICEKCKNPEATYSQVLQHNIPVVEGMPPVIPDDGTFSYQATCRKCFVRK
jgi:thymidine kinase